MGHEGRGGAGPGSGVANLQFDPPLHRQTGKQTDRALGHPEKLKVFEPAGNLGSEFADFCASQVEMPQRRKAFKLQEAFVGERATGEVEHSQVFELLGAKAEEDGKHVVGPLVSQRHSHQLVGDMAEVFAE